MTTIWPPPACTRGSLPRPDPWAPAEAARTEVDFILERDRDYVAIEAKSATIVGSEELRGLRAIKGMRRLRRRFLVHPGRRVRVTEDGIEIWPVKQLVAALETDKLWLS